ncbi:MAG TPA: amidohydrolase family protein [Pyrinomonadaceae bacterium]|jgi:imidazolonepropionase-like amidohydrolase|nr:amidohydrolase family protein [Pyrinomonadaceae bacterium]
MRIQPARRSRAATTLSLAFVVSLVAGLVAFAASPPGVARAQRSAIDTYAITGARIVPVSGAEIPRGTVVIRGGLIAAVGANVPAPPDARIIDGTGLTIYPGLIDANTNLGMPASQQPRPATGGGGGGVAAFLAAQQQATPAVSSPNSSQPVGLQPEILASDVVRPGGEQIEAARGAGLTAALTAPREGIFMGQSAVINLAGETPQQMIVRSPIALHVGFTPLRTGTYPGSLLGVFAAIRQMMLDAQRYREANAVYEKSPRGLRRPDQDKSLAALMPVLARQMPLIVYADRQREIERALDLAQEFNVRLIIAGGAESWLVTERLAAAKVPVLLSLNYPRRTTAETPEADPDPIRVLRERVNAPKTAARLAAAGVRFAFQSGGLSNMNDYLGNVSKSLDNGLARDEAVRALTIRAAEILGVEAQLGTIEVGKIANLTVTRGDLFARDRRITHVFIDGRPVDLRPAPSTPAGGQGRSLASGTWTLRVQLEGQPERSVTLTLQQETERLSGSIQGDLGSAQIANASVGAAGDIKFTVPITTGAQTTEATFTGTISGNEMRGAVTTIGTGAGTFNGTRAGGGGGATPATTPATTATPTPTPAAEGTTPPQ